MRRSVESVIEKMDTMLGTSGGHLELVDYTGDTVVVRYAVPAGDDCEDCVMTDESLQMFIQEALSQSVPSVNKVEVIH